MKLIVRSCIIYSILFISRISSEVPRITVNFWGGDVNQTSLPNNNEIYYSEFGAIFEISCYAQYPIVWNVEGVIAPIDIISVLPPLNTNSENFELGMRLNYFKAIGYCNPFTSLTITCESIADININSSTKIFTTGGGSQSKLFTSEASVQNSKIIPCLTTNPFATVQLFKRTTEGEEELFFPYEPTKGFSSSVMFSGTYICQQLDFSQEIIAQGRQPDPDYELFPENSEILAYTDEKIHMNCTSRNLPISFDITVDPNITVNVLADTTTHQWIELQLSEEFWDASEFVNPIRATITCYSSGPGLYWYWYAEFLPRPTIHVQRSSNSIKGNVSVTNTIVYPGISYLANLIECSNPLECQINKRCLNSNAVGCKDTSILNFGTSHVHNNMDYSIEFRKWNGIINVAVDSGPPHGSHATEYRYFVGLDKITAHTAWEEAYRNRQLIKMDDIPEYFYVTSLATFRCTALAYLFTEISFSLGFVNESIKLLAADNSVKMDDGLSIEAEVTTAILENAVKINCYAHWWNSTETVAISKSFETKQLAPPKIIGWESKLKFYLSQKSNQIVCHGVGEPSCTYKWKYKKLEEDEFKNAFDVFHDDLISNRDPNNDDIEFLYFLNVKMNHSGVYRCTAINSVDDAEKVVELIVINDLEFETTETQTDADMEADDDDDDEFNIIPLILIITGACATLLIPLFACLAILRKKYIHSKVHLRNLTDEEIQDFTDGNANILYENGDLPTGESTNFLPYDPTHEIALNDLELDERKMLGSGHFSYVLKGKIISRNKPVAVKITKESVDIELFKSLLTEVKVMIYLGHHKNLVEFVGVCTENIRFRSLYIVTEICELGSLSNFLRDNRSNFVNFLDPNYKRVGMNSYARRDRFSFTTLHLIRFAKQIAAGMEFLEDKKVIHADLAARNVLLTSNMTAKVSDFGLSRKLSRKLYTSNLYIKKTECDLPWRWMAPESLSSLTFSTKSDVWSYGMTLYEIFTLGDIPFANEVWSQEFLGKVQNGMRMGRPEYSSIDVYSNMSQCWEKEPSHRPNFSVLKKSFKEILAKLNAEESVHKMDYSGAQTRRFSPECFGINRFYQNVSGHSNTYKYREFPKQNHKMNGYVATEDMGKFGAIYLKKFPKYRINQPSPGYLERDEILDYIREVNRE